VTAADRDVIAQAREVGPGLRAATGDRDRLAGWLLLELADRLERLGRPEERIVGLAERLTAAVGRIAQLEDDLRDALNRIHVLEDDTPQARQLQYEADQAAADLTESGYDRHGRDCQCPYCATDEDEGGASEFRWLP
jgi:hypothetical protein